MCCFSQPVKSVSATNIFARPDDNDRQLLVYSMSLNADKDLAMILPLPVKTPAGEKDVEFIDLKGYPDFFSDLLSGFPMPPLAAEKSAAVASESAARAPLEVVKVGDFEASFVPAMKDFSRLDKRFRLPSDAWKKLPEYESWGFAVFKLKPGAMTVHPMAFSFIRRDVKHSFSRLSIFTTAQFMPRLSSTIHFIASRITTITLLWAVRGRSQRGQPVRL
jgi:hypothetical protein